MYFLMTVLILFGTFLLSIAMNKHFRSLSPSGSQPYKMQMTFRVMGWGCLFAALIAGTNVESIGVAITTCFGIFTLTHIIVALFLGLSRES